MAFRGSVERPAYNRVPSGGRRGGDCVVEEERSVSGDVAPPANDPVRPKSRAASPGVAEPSSPHADDTGDAVILPFPGGATERPPPTLMNRRASDRPTAGPARAEAATKAAT